ncbi:MAG: hypothetical protein IKB73_06090 [Ruminococcus sp.]|nr:hypothetical protein [Ruminococcus sp.]
MKISQLTNDKVMISLCSDDMKNFELEFNELGLSNPHSKRIITRLLTLACTSSGLATHNKQILCEALPNCDGCVLLISLSDKKQKRKTYRIKRIKEYPCFKFSSAEHFMSAVEKLYCADCLFYNNSAFLYKENYYLVFDYPLVPKCAEHILLEFSKRVKGSKTFISRLCENAKALSRGNAIIHIGSFM